MIYFIELADNEEINTTLDYSEKPIDLDTARKALFGAHFEEIDCSGGINIYSVGGDGVLRKVKR